MNINHISVSRKLVWDQCKQLYKYKYHLKVPSPEEEPFYFVYGKIIHKIAEVYVAARGAKTLDEVKAEVLSGKILIEEYGGVEIRAPELPFDYRMRMSEHLGAVKKLTAQVGYDGELEWPFEIDLDPPNDKKVVGFIDRLIRKDDNFFIIDYKTTKKGRWRKDENSIRYDLQLRTYARIIQKTFNVPAANIRTALYYLEGGNLIGAKYTDQSLLSAEEELLECYNDIIAADPEKVWGRYGDHCNRCDYRSICPFKKRPLPEFKGFN